MKILKWVVISLAIFVGLSLLWLKISYGSGAPFPEIQTAPIVADEEMEQQQPSGHRPEGFCRSVMARHDVCHYSEVDERSARRAVYAHRGAQAVLKRPSEHRGTR